MDTKSEDIGDIEKRSPQISDEIPVDVVPLHEIPKSRWERSWPVIACGAGLFSDGYLNGVCASPPLSGLQWQG